MVEQGPYSSERAREAHEYLLELGKISVQMASVERATHYPPGRPENDAEHSFNLGLSAMELAANYYPELDTGLVAQFSYVHDLVEVHTGDTPTFDITAEARAAKEAAEQAAVERLLKELPPHTASLLERYEKQTEPEARFVRFIDKLLPAIIHSVATDVNREVFKDAYGLKTAAEVTVTRRERTAYLQKLFPDFDFIHEVRELVSQTSRERIFGSPEE